MKTLQSIRKTILIVLTTTILVTLTITSVAMDIEKNDLQHEITSQILASGLGDRPTNNHMVLGEQGTATWCVHCPSMGQWLAQVSGNFVYIALISDVNIYASMRCSELGLTGYPTTFFDGGFTSVIGHQYNVNNLQSAYDQCEDRTVADLTVSVGAALDEDTGKVDVVTFIDNNEDSEFTGRLRVFVCEKVSRYDDYDGDPYVNGMVGYATNALVTIPAGASINRPGTYTFPLLTADNTLIVAALYDNSNAYVQQVAITTPKKAGDGGGIDVIPPVLTIESPEENEVLSGIIDISGSAHHPKGDGNLKWTLVKIDDDDWVSAEGTSDWSYSWDTTSVEDGPHIIRAVTSDGKLSSGVDKITVMISNYNMPPEAPGLPIGPADAIAGEPLTYTVETTDPDGDEIQYGLDWNGDGEVDEWTDFYPSGESVDVIHTFDTDGTFQIQVKAKDSYLEESAFSPAAQVIIFGTNTEPTISIVKPTNAIYMNNEMMFSFPKTFIIGTIDVIAEASDVESEIDYVELYIDSTMHDDVFSGPYEFTDVSMSFGRHKIRLVAYDMSGLSGEDEISVFKLF